MTRLAQLLTLTAFVALLGVQLSEAAPFAGDFGDILFREKRQDTNGERVSANGPASKTEDTEAPREKKQLVVGFADGSASGTVLGGRRKRQLVFGYADGFTSGTWLGRRKRQLVAGFADGATRGTILGRKRRQLVYGYADGSISGTWLG